MPETCPTVRTLCLAMLQMLCIVYTTVLEYLLPTTMPAGAQSRAPGDRAQLTFSHDPGPTISMVV